MDYLTPLLTTIGSLILGYMSFRLGKLQVVQASKGTEMVDRSTTETEFRKSLLELIDSQEEKISRQEAKIEKLDEQVERGKKLTDELKRANFNFALENQRLTRATADLDADVQRLRQEVIVLKSKQVQQEALNDANK